MQYAILNNTLGTGNIMSVKSMKSDLFENAIDSLVEGLIKYNSTRTNNPKPLKFAVLNISRFVELSFKYFLYRIHPLLIYKGPYKGELNRNSTVSMDEAINFYKHSHDEEALLYDDEREDHFRFLDDIKFLKNLRNSIEHFEYEEDKEKVKLTIGRILSLLDRLYKEHDVIVHEKLVVTKEILSLYRALIDDYEHKRLVAQDKAKDIANIISPEWIEHDVQTCPYCNEYTYVFDQSNNNFICTYCQEYDKAVNCTVCYCKFPRHEAWDVIEESGTYWCSEECLINDQNSKGCGPNQ